MTERVAIMAARVEVFVRNAAVFRERPIARFPRPRGSAVIELREKAHEAGVLTPHVLPDTIAEQTFREIGAFRFHDGFEFHEWSLAGKIKRHWKAAQG